MPSYEHVFTTAAPYYDAFRVPYPPALFDAILDTLALEPGQQAIDVGAGTAQIALALASRGLHVLALEPNEAMRAIAQEKLRQRARCPSPSALATPRRSPPLMDQPRSSPSGALFIGSTPKNVLKSWRSSTTSSPHRAASRS